MRRPLLPDQRLHPRLDGAISFLNFALFRVFRGLNPGGENLRKLRKFSCTVVRMARIGRLKYRQHMTKSECANAKRTQTDVHHSCFVIHSSFSIRTSSL
jgi:hypothetical protein